MKINKKGLLPAFVSSVAAAALAAVAASAANSPPPGPRAGNEKPPPAHLKQNQFFTGQLQPIQTQGPATKTSGSVAVQTTSGSFMAGINAQSVPPNMAHFQAVQTGGRCPTTTDDQNGDGFVDAVEAAAAVGQVLIPLDNDLSQQLSQAGRLPGNIPAGFPVADSSGNLRYSGGIALAALLADLRAADPDPSDALAKLASGEDLNVGSRVIVIYGVPETTSLPNSVQTILGFSRAASLPIACAQLTSAMASATPLPPGETPPPGQPGQPPTQPPGEPGVPPGQPPGEPGVPPGQPPGEPPPGVPPGEPPIPPPGVPPGEPPPPPPGEPPLPPPWGSPTATPWGTPSPTPWVTPSPTPWGSPTATPWGSPTATPWGSPTATPWHTPTATPWHTPTATPWHTPTATPWSTPVATPWRTPPWRTPPPWWHTPTPPPWRTPPWRTPPPWARTPPPHT